MRKLRFSMLGVLVAGLVLIGIGLGVTFTEWSGLSYAGEYVPGSAERKEQTVTFALGETSLPVFVEYYGGGNDHFGGITYAASETITPGTLQIYVAYRTMGPRMEIESIAHQQQDFRLYWSNWNDLSVLMTMKDAVLQDLKAGKLGSYLPCIPEEITVSYHPDDAKRMVQAV